MKSGTITPLVEKNVSDKATIDSDSSASYIKLKDIVREHRPQVIPRNETGKILPRVPIAISNAKRQILDMYHNVKSEFLQMSYVTN